MAEGSLVLLETPESHKLVLVEPVKGDIKASKRLFILFALYTYQVIIILLVSLAVAIPLFFFFCMGTGKTIRVLCNAPRQTNRRSPIERLHIHGNVIDATF